MNRRTWQRGPFAIYGGIPTGRTRATLRWAADRREMRGLQFGRVGVALDCDGYHVFNLDAGMLICWARTLPAAVRLAQALAPLLPRGRWGQRPARRIQLAVAAVVDAAIAGAPADYAYLEPITDRKWHGPLQDLRARLLAAAIA